jgi:hypothetical protein
MTNEDIPALLIQLANNVLARLETIPRNEWRADEHELHKEATKFLTATFRVYGNILK